MKITFHTMMILNITHPIFLLSGLFNRFNITKPVYVPNTECLKHTVRITRFRLGYYI